MDDRDSVRSGCVGSAAPHRGNRFWLIGVAVAVLLAGPVLAWRVEASPLFQVTDTPTLTNTPVPTATITGIPGGLITSTPPVGGTLFVSGDCGGSAPYGWGTVTPSGRWLMTCSQCLSQSGQWLGGTATPVPTFTVTATGSTFTPTPYGGTPTNTATPTKTPTVTATPANVWYLDGWPDTVNISKYWTGPGLPPLYGYTAQHMVPDWPGMKVQGFVATVGYSCSGSCGQFTAADDGTGHPPNWLKGGSYNFSGSETVCEEGQSTGACAWAATQGLTFGRTITDPGSPFTNITQTMYFWLAFRVQSGNTGGRITAWVQNIHIIYRGGWGWPGSGFVPTATPGPLYCGNVESAGPEAFSWSGIVYGGTSCFDVGPYSVLAWSVPWLAHVCLQSVSLGTLFVFGVGIYVDYILLAAFAIWGLSVLYHK